MGKFVLSRLNNKFKSALRFIITSLDKSLNLTKTCLLFYVPHVLDKNRNSNESP